MPDAVDAWVLDASVTLAWVFDDEARPETDLLMDRILADDVVVPSLWRLEIANALLTALRRGRLTYDVALNRLGDLLGLSIVVADPPDKKATMNAFGWGQGYGLSAYDASYLDLAYWKGIPIATLDRKLARAARELGVPVHPALTSLI